MNEKIRKLSFPIAILIASIILGGFFYASQVNKQKSIEKQQQIALQAKTEQEHKEYVAKRKLECYKIEQRESKNWDNVVSGAGYYSEGRNICIVKYKSKEPAQSKEECDKIFEDAQKYPNTDIQVVLLDSYLDCSKNWISREF